MTDNEIIKALECCVRDGYPYGCKECPYNNSNLDCNERLDADALYLINRQKAEIEELEAEIDKQYEQAEANILANMADGGTSCHWCIDKHQANAIKEFAERVKAETTERYEDIAYKDLFFGVIDYLVKEMVGDN